MSDALPSKRCTMCGREMPLSRFGSKGGGRLRAECNDCRAYRVRAKRNGHAPLTRAPEPETKTCVQCGETKPISGFAPTRNGRHMLSCHACAFPLPPSDMTERTCVRCGQSKPLSEFSKRRGRWPKVWCKACGRAYKAAWGQRNRERVMQYHRDHPHYGAQAAMTRRARLNRATIERIDRALVIARDQGVCYICGAKPTGFNLTLDHVVPLSKGGTHTMDNLRVACRPCNSRKSTHPPAL